jgi:hypothetical protein
MEQNIEDSTWVINFFEIFKITSAIYSDSVEYSLVKVKSDQKESLDAYRLFSQLKDQSPRMIEEASDISENDRELWSLEDD